MLNIDEVNKTILDLEQHDTTYATCEKLAWLYIVRDHLTNNNGTLEQTNTSSESPSVGDSEFLAAASGVNISDLLKILDEHMEVVKLLHPKEYSSLISKMREL